MPGWIRCTAAWLEFVCLILAGCSSMPSRVSEPETPAAETTAVPEEEALTTVTVAGSVLFTEEFTASMLKEGIRLEAVTCAENAWREGELPEADVYILDSEYDLTALWQAEDEGKFAGFSRSLYADTDAAELLDRYYPFWNDGKGNLIALPEELFDAAGFTVSPYVVYYRKDWSKRLELGEDPGEADWQDLMTRANGFAHLDCDRDGTVNSWGITAGGTAGLAALFLEDMGVREWVLEDGEWIPGLMSERAKEGFAWMRQLLRDGVLDPESLTQTEDEALKKLGEGKTGIAVIKGSDGVLDAWLAGHESDDEARCLERLGVYPLPVDPYGTRYAENSISSRVAVLSADTDDEKTTAVLKVLIAWRAFRETDEVPEDGVASAVAAEESYSRCVWKSPMFTDWLGDEKVAAFDVGISGAAEERLYPKLMSSESWDTVWKEWLDYCRESLNAEEIIKIVNEAAELRGIVTEE